ncbi:MAG: endonuclease domain-containing protein [Candidatus Bathyarchaeota archaeon]|nr:endonuclease domain-containing protein [Candidatus Bathyarchaeota archaeon]
MSFKRQMHPKVSKAEVEVFKALSAAGLTRNMVTQKTIILKSTVPDFCWPSKRKIVYLDGVQAHLGDKQQKRDEEICELLTEQGWEVLRIPYEPPLSEKNLKKIVDTIKKFVGTSDEE